VLHRIAGTRIRGNIPALQTLDRNVALVCSSPSRFSRLNWLFRGIGAGEIGPHMYYPHYVVMESPAQKVRPGGILAQYWCRSHLF
jgi:hypothetical protein